MKKSPYVIQETAGFKSYCACGLSQTLPHCDGAHKGNSDKRPVKVSLEEAKQVAICGCQQSANFPYCDGTHSKL